MTSSTTDRKRARRREPVVVVAGTRPNFVKLAPLVRAARARGLPLVWVHAGQHRSHAMSEAHLRALELPPPAVRLPGTRSGPGRIDRTTAHLMRALPVLRPRRVVVLGDVDASLAAARAAGALALPVAHVEAGLRAFDRRMPEERNRIAIDHASDLWHTTEPVAVENLRAEGIRGARVRRSGNVMADALEALRQEIEARRPEGRDPYAVVTLHRQANVDDPRRLSAWVDALVRAAARVPLEFPVHPRTRRRLGSAAGRLRRAGVRLRAPLDYLTFLGLVAGAAVVATDSGGAQVEASLLGVPCLTLRPQTEHLLTVERGTNRVLGADPRRMPKGLAEALASPPAPRGRRPRDWDGRAAERIAADWAALG